MYGTCRFLFSGGTRLSGAVGTATAYGLGDRGDGVRVPVGSEFSLLHIVQTGSGAHPTPLASS
jgi:hypothetical protein